MIYVRKVFTVSAFIQILNARHFTCFYLLYALPGKKSTNDDERLRYTAAP